MELKILTSQFLAEFTERGGASPLDKLEKMVTAVGTVDLKDFLDNYLNKQH